MSDPKHKELHEALSAIIPCTLTEVEIVFRALEHDRYLAERADRHATKQDITQMRAIAADVDRAIRRIEALPEGSGAAFAVSAGNVATLNDLRKLRDHLMGYADFVTGDFAAKMYPAPNGRKEQARVIAEAVAYLFVAKERNVGVGRDNYSREPSTPFGRAVREALAVYGVDANWRIPAEHAAKVVRSPN